MRWYQVMYITPWLMEDEAARESLLAATEGPDGTRAASWHRLPSRDKDGLLAFLVLGSEGPRKDALREWKYIHSSHQREEPSGTIRGIVDIRHLMSAGPEYICCCGARWPEASA